MANAGYDLVSQIWRFTESPNDDDIGGARPSGTILYQNVATRIAALKPTQVILEQGIEVPNLFEAQVFPATMQIIHNDQLEVTLPVNSKFYNKRFRVIGIRDVSTHASNSRNFITLTLRRVERSIQNVYQ